MSVGKIIFCLLVFGFGGSVCFTSFYVNHSLQKLMVPDTSLGLMEDRLTLPASETKTRREELENLRTKIREDDFCRFLMKY
eukprot:13345.XXX_271093_270804_1 [CDS] Oithona nana genome sequencing.